MALTADIQQQVYDLLSRASNISFVTAEQGQGILSALAPGQRVNAEVLSLLPNNRAQVRVGTERLNLDLPMAVRRGQTLEMTYLSGEPRITFAIARPGEPAPPVSLSSAARLLSMLITSEQIVDPGLRSSLQSISGMLRRSSGDADVLASLLDDALTYQNAPEGQPGAAGGKTTGEAGGRQAAPGPPGDATRTFEQARLASFEASASRILGTIAHNSRYTLIEAANPPVVPLPLAPGEEIDAAVVGTLPGRRAFVQVAGTTLEMVMPRTVRQDEILRLTFISSLPKPLFAIARPVPEVSPGLLSEAGRWLSVLEHSEGGVSAQQMYVLERLDTVLTNLRPDSAAFSVIKEDPLTYRRTGNPRATLDQANSAHPSLQPGSGIVLSDDMARLLQAVIKGNRLALLEALNQQSTPSGFAPGQQLKGEVLAALGAGRFMVRLAGREMEFALPKGIRRGDMLSLFFITEEPRQTYLMARFGKPGDSRVSETGRWLSAFIAGTTPKIPAQATMGILRTLLSAPPADASQVDRLLRQGLRESGFFYESHLARWFEGDYPLADILREPQGRLSPRLQLPVERSETSAGGLARASMKTGSTEVVEEVFRHAGTETAHEGIADQRALPVVKEQLTALQENRIVFRGDLFPGQHMEWQVEERDARRNRDGVRERSWETGLRLEMPRLGNLNLRIALDGINVSMDIRAEEIGTVPLLEAGRDRLENQLAAAGLTPLKIGIHNGTP